MLLTWLGAAGFKIDTNEGATLLIDPYLSRPEKARPKLPIELADLSHVDEIFLTNGRFDHGLDTPALSQQTGAIVHAPELACRRLAEMGISNHSLEGVILNKSQRIGSLVWRGLPSLINQVDSSPVLRALMHSPALLPQIKLLDREWPSGEIVAYFFEAEGISMVHFGSAAWLDSEISQLQPDLALLPVENEASPNTGAVRLASLLKPKVVIPHHWDDYYPPLSQMINLKQFEAALQTVVPGLRVYKPTIGQSFNPADLLF